MPSSPPPLEMLKDEIDAKRKFIASLPPSSSIDDLFSLAKHQKILGEKEEEYELTLETQRRASVVREHKELHPPITEECPICLEDIDISFQQSMSYFSCCGNGCCKKCADYSRSQGVNRMLKCPLCRADFHHFDEVEKLMNLVMQRAKDGRSWAQCQLGVNFLDGKNGFAVDNIEGLKWIELAAEQRYPIALCKIGDIHYHGLGDIVEQSYSKARAFTKEAADLGNVTAQVQLSELYLWGEGGPVDKAKAVYYSTLAYSEDSNPVAACHLGVLFEDGWGGFGKSMYRAKYYLKESAEKGFERAYQLFAMVLLQICKVQYRGINTDTIPGHSCIPSALFWARKAVGNGDTHAMELAADMERRGQERCANCTRDAGCFSGKMKRCTRCKAVWYCGKECQQKHWKDGHKVDCVKQE